MPKTNDFQKEKKKCATMIVVKSGGDGDDDDDMRGNPVSPTSTDDGRGSAGERGDGGRGFGSGHNRTKDSGWMSCLPILLLIVMIVGLVVGLVVGVGGSSLSSSGSNATATATTANDGSSNNGSTTSGGGTTATSSTATNLVFVCPDQQQQEQQRGEQSESPPVIIAVTDSFISNCYTSSSSEKEETSNINSSSSNSSTSSCTGVYCCPVVVDGGGDEMSSVCDLNNAGSPADLKRCVVDAGQPLPDNPNCPSLPFYIVPKTNLPNLEHADVVTFGAVGDIILESTLQRQAARHGSYAESWEAVVPYLTRPDIMYANFEGTTGFIESVPEYPDPNNPDEYILRDYQREEQPLRYGETVPSVFYSGGPFLQFNYHPMLGRDIADSGIDVVSTSNNHCLDRGLLGINSTIDTLQRAGVAHAGTRRTQDEPFHAIITTKDGWRIAIAACTDGTNFSRNRRDRQKDLVLNCYTERYENLVRALSADPTIHAVIVAVHWGSTPPPDEEGDAARAEGYGEEGNGFGARGIVYQRQPDCSMRHWTEKMAEAGAAVILGAHQHVLHGWEKFTTSFGRSVLIVHGLGNFNSHGGWLATKPPPAFLGRGWDSDIGFLYRRTSVLLQFAITWNSEQNWAEVKCLSYIPLQRTLTDIGFVEEALAEQNETTYEVHVEVPSETSIERQFIAEVFGPLRKYADGGGVWNGAPWEAQIDSNGQYEMTCYPFSDARETDVDRSIYPTVVHQNDDSSESFPVASGLCLKCELLDGDESNCRWCQYRRNSYCTGPSSTKIDFGSSIAWDDCLRIAQSNSSCSEVAYGGGDLGRCQCLRAGERCNIGRSTQSQVVYVRQCGSEPRLDPL